MKSTILSCQIYAVPDLCCIVTRRSVGSVGGVFDPVVSSDIALLQQSLGVTICMLIKWTLQASQMLQADSMFLV